VVVAIPARDESVSVGQCIRSVDQAAAEISLPVLVVVAADSCADDTEEIARTTSTEFCEIAVIAGGWGRAGAARAAAVHHGLDVLPFNRRPLWIANTDADCLVPQNWLRTQLELATDLDAIAGIVALDPTATPPAMFEAFTSPTCSMATTMATFMARTSAMRRRVPGRGGCARDNRRRGPRMWNVRGSADGCGRPRCCTS
jgi:glycosyltransferase involved in cell wall biosynthesis